MELFYVKSVIIKFTEKNMKIDSELFEKMPKELQDLFELKHNPECPCYMLDKQSGKLGISRGGNSTNIGGFVTAYADKDKIGKPSGYGDTGGASRFFYVAKASKSERNAWLEGMQNIHPTVKPLKLMEYLCILTKTPTGGIVLDPFLGSGTTAMACISTGRDFIGIEKKVEYCKIAEERLKGVQKCLI